MLSARTICRKVVGCAEQGEMTEVGSPFLRIAVDQPDEVDPVLGMLEQLAGNELADVPGTDDHRVLQVGTRSP